MRYLSLAVLLLFSNSASPSDDAVLAYGYIHEEKVALYLEKIPFVDHRGRQLYFRKGAPTQALMDMVTYAASHGYEIQLNSAYRTFEHQKELWKKIPHLAAEPGKGGPRSHQTGCAVDIRGTIKEINGIQHKTILYWWLNRFAKKFGFVNNVEGEPWHWTYLGPIESEEDPIEIGGE